MKKILSLSLLFLMPAMAAQDAGVPIGNGLAKGVNEILLDKDAHCLFVQFADLFLDKVHFTKEQWAQLKIFLVEGRDLLNKKLDPKMRELQTEYEKEHRDLFEAIFDPESGDIDFAGAQELIQEALQELQQDERFEEIRKFNEAEQCFKKKVATCLLTDLATGLNEEETENANGIFTDQINEFAALLSHMIESVEKKLAS